MTRYMVAGATRWPKEAMLQALRDNEPTPRRRRRMVWLFVTTFAACTERVAHDIRKVGRFAPPASTEKRSGLAEKLGENNIKQIETVLGVMHDSWVCPEYEAGNPAHLLPYVANCPLCLQRL